MIEKVFKMSQEDKTVVEKLILEDNLHYIHMVFTKDKGLPLHYSNAVVHMNVVRGKLSITLGDQDTKIYEAGTLLEIPFNVKMNVRNEHDETLELIVIKAPGPKVPVKYVGVCKKSL
ncbi:cupin domain-containing protein [uncultured Ilyobacter sp.]|uniref:cupin domain-containing protein n=1 Tax=uncultured Ilyobacter sp. TaxID=544433 RepID=UPI0029C80C74|nr:cupin domain-containing protein [uncultured Ilyobacter sp.]